MQLRNAKPLHRAKELPHRRYALENNNWRPSNFIDPPDTKNHVITIGNGLGASIKA
jgi:hypothetical protein